VSRKNVEREGRKRSQKWYEKKKTKNTEDNENEHELGSASSSSKTEWLVVKLPSHKTPAKGGFIRKKYRQSLRKAYRQNDELSFKMIALLHLYFEEIPLQFCRMFFVFFLTTKGVTSADIVFAARIFFFTKFIFFLILFGVPIKFSSNLSSHISF
jgi:hypothetical protein